MGSRLPALPRPSRSRTGPPMFESLSSRLQGIAQQLRGKARITEADLECRRPGAGRTSFDFYEVIGSVATQDYAIGEYVGQ